MSVTTIGDLRGGDIVKIDGVSLRLMIELKNAWGCRTIYADGTWSDDHVWYKMDVVVDMVVQRSNTKSGGKQDSIDPLMKR